MICDTRTLVGALSFVVALSKPRQNKPMQRPRSRVWCCPSLTPPPPHTSSSSSLLVSLLLAVILAVFARALDAGRHPFACLPSEVQAYYAPQHTSSALDVPSRYARTPSSRSSPPCTSDAISLRVGRNISTAFPAAFVAVPAAFLAVFIVGVGRAIASCVLSAVLSSAFRVVSSFAIVIAMTAHRVILALGACCVQL